MILKNKKQRIWFVIIIQSLALLFTAHFSNYTIAPTPRLYAFFLFSPLFFYFIYLPYINNIIMNIYAGGLNPKNDMERIIILSLIIDVALLSAYMLFDFQPQLFKEFIGYE